MDAPNSKVCLERVVDVKEVYDVEGRVGIVKMVGNDHFAPEHTQFAGVLVYEPYVSAILNLGIETSCEKDSQNGLGGGYCG